MPDPKILIRLTNQLRSKGVTGAKSMAIGLLKKNGILNKNSLSLTAKGKKRQALGNAGRAKDRAASKGKYKPSDYKYNPKTNKATLKRKK